MFGQIFGFSDGSKMSRDLSSYLPTNGITSNRGESAVPQPPKHISCRFHASVFRTGIVRVGLLLGIRHYGVPFFRDSNANKEDITLLEGDIAFLGDFVNIRQAHLVRRKSGIFNPLFLSPCGIVDQYSTSYHAITVS